MAMSPKPSKDLKANAEQALQETAKQTRAALDNYFDFIQRAVSSYPSGGTKFAEKLKYYTEKNIAAAQGFVHGLTQATDLNDVFRIQTEFMQMQLNAFGEQAKSLGDAFTKVATGAMQTPFKKV